MFPILLLFIYLTKLSAAQTTLSNGMINNKLERMWNAQVVVA
jgi:hypothetical protein